MGDTTMDKHRAALLAVHAWMESDQTYNTADIEHIALAVRDALGNGGADDARQARAMRLSGEAFNALGVCLGLITKHGLAVTLAREDLDDFERLQQARTVFAKLRD